MSFNEQDASRSQPSAGDVLPSAPVASAPAGTPVSLRSGRGPRIVLVAHDADCNACRAWLDALAADDRARADWGARVAYLVPDSLPRARQVHAQLPEGVQVLSDPESALGLAPGWLVIADEWGEVYFATTVEGAHDLPDAAEIAEWARFIAVQCPECEQPEGAWKS